MAAAAAEQSQHQLPGVEQLRRYAIENLGGFLGGAVSVFLGHPFDTIKVRVQAGHTAYAGAADCLRRTVQAEGARALFKGLLSPLLATGSINALTFSTQQEVLRLLHPASAAGGAAPAPLSVVAASGGVAGVVQCVIATPVELVRTKLQVQHEGSRAYRGVVDCIRQVVRSEGFPGLYRGNMSMVFREGPAFTVYFGVYEATKRAVCPSLGADEHEPLWVEAAGGGATGAVTWMAVMPMDVISTRIQSLPEAQVADPDKRSIPRVARQIWQESGVRGFYRGLGTAVLRGFVLNSFVFPVYETTVRYFS